MEEAAIAVVIDFLTKCSNSKEDMTHFQTLLNRCPNLNTPAVFHHKGLSFDSVSRQYKIAPGGSYATLAHYCALIGRTDFLILLREHGASLGEKINDSHGKPVTPKDVAVANGHARSIEYLTHNSAPVSRLSGNVCIVM